MTIVSFDLGELQRRVGRPLPRTEVEERLPMMGVAFEGWEGDTLSIDVFANHPDWYSVEGLARGLRGFLGVQTGLQQYAITDSGHAFTVEKGVEAVRPFAAGAFVRGLALDDAGLKSILDFQEKLHTTIGRRRKKVAIGIHDADTVTPPFTYRAVAPDGVRFTPLGSETAMTPGEILEGHEKGREFAAALGTAGLCPIITDAKGEVLSFPPIINGTVTRLGPKTRNLFLDVTGTDWPAVNIVLNLLVTALADRGGTPQSVRMAYPDRVAVTPDLRPRPMDLDLEAASRLLGIPLTTKDAIDALVRLRYDVTARGGRLTVFVPSYRSDILHPTDIIEDIAVGYGYERIAPRSPTHATVGRPTKRQETTALLRALMVGHGFQEAMTLTLVPRSEAFVTAGRVTLQNPISEETAVLRSALLPGLLSLLQVNKHRDLPQRLFEVGPVVIDGANALHLAGVSIHAKAGFTEAKSLVQGILRDLGRAMEVQKTSDENYLPGRCGSVMVDGHEVGRFGEVHPRVIEGHDLKHPVITFELNADAL